MSSSSSLNSLLSSSSASSSSSLDISSLLAAATGASSTGIDVTSAVDAAVYAARAPERQWQAEQSTIQSQITALSSIKSAASSLSADLDHLNDPFGALAARSVSSSNSAAVTATAAAGSAIGTHTVSVSGLATAAAWYSPVVASATASLGSSQLTITKADGTQASFSLPTSGNNSLSGLVTSINAASLGVTASTVKDASGYRLALVGSATGADSDFTVAQSSSTASSWSSAELPGSSTQLAAGSFEVSNGNSSAAIAVSAGSTLADVAHQINGQALGLNATVVTNASGTYLSITGTNGGQVTMSTDPALVMTRAARATNATLDVDGVPVTSSSNTVTGALSGVTLDLLGITPGSQVSLNIAPDSSTIKSTVSQFVTDYNSAVSQLSSQFTYSASSSSEGVLGADSSMRSLQTTLLAIAGYSSSSSGPISSLANLGITMNNDGSLTLDSSVLDQAIANDSSSLQTFFQGTSSNGFSTKVNAQLETFTKANVGVIAVDVNNLTQQYNDLQSNVNDYESGYIASQQTLLTSMYSHAEIALQSLPATLKELGTQLGQNSGG